MHLKKEYFIRYRQADCADWRQCKMVDVTIIGSVVACHKIAGDQVRVFQMVNGDVKEIGMPAANPAANMEKGK